MPRGGSLRKARINNTSFFQAIKYQYNTRAPVWQYNTNAILNISTT
jgi:hypothetical protein